MLKIYAFLLTFFNNLLFYFPVTFTTYAVFIMVLRETNINRFLLIWLCLHFLITLIFTLIDFYKRRKNGRYSK